MELFKNIKVLSLEQATVLPYLTYRLAMDGCRIIRLEHPVYGDPNRFVGEAFLDDEKRMNSYFMAINAGKEAVTLNLATPEGRDILEKMIIELDADIFATNQLPKNYEKLGIDYPRLSSIKKDLIWLGVTGFGPDSNEAAYDPILQARGGLMELTGEKDQAPQVVGIPLPDMGTSEHCYGLLMKALFKRAATGEGSRIDMSMFDSVTSWLTVPITMTASFDKVITRRGATHEFFAPVSVYPTQDGFVYIAVGNDKQFQAMVQLPEFQALNKEEYEKNSGRIADVENLNRAIEEITSGMTTEKLLSLTHSINVAASKINTMAEVIKDPLVERNLIRSKDPKTGFELTLAPPPYANEFLKSTHMRLDFPPRFGEHNEKILGKELGYSEDDIKSFREAGVI
jgi:formyl-CoA transferase